MKQQLPETPQGDLDGGKCVPREIEVETDHVFLCVLLNSLEKVADRN